MRAEGPNALATGVFKLHSGWSIFKYLWYQERIQTALVLGSSLRIGPEIGTGRGLHLLFRIETGFGAKKGGRGKGGGGFGCIVWELAPTVLVVNEVQQFSGFHQLIW